MIKYLVLGPIEAWSEQRHIELRGSLQRAVLVTLLASSGNFVLTEAFINELWGETPPRRAENALQAHVSRLRRALDKLEPGRESSSVVTLSSGYRLELGPDATDAMIFMRSVDRVFHHQGEIDAREAIQQLRDALSLWRGTVFGGAVGGTLCQSLAARYEQSRVAALERLFDLGLQIGLHSEFIAELYEATESEPLNEKLCGQLMVALYRAGRQADALAVYRKMRARLDDQLGIAPSPLLQKHEQAILTQDPALETPAGNQVNNDVLRPDAGASGASTRTPVPSGSRPAAGLHSRLRSAPAWSIPRPRSRHTFPYGTASP
ncbi:MAG TPA: AfsR/SARP family transcriptional regulator [Streptosporangiaceae bacterium]